MDWKNMRLVILFLLGLATTLAAIAPEKAIESNKNLRILELLPDLSYPLAVEPGIPDDFVAMSPQGEPDLYSWVYWGPKNVLKAYFKDPKSLKQPILRVKLSANVAQTGPKTFGEETAGIIEQKRKDEPNFRAHEYQWGSYPVLSFSDISDEKGSFLGWVGLNDPEGGYTLMFNLVRPSEKQLTKEDKALWNQLMTETTPLKDGDFFRANGQDLQPGYTIFKAGQAKLKMTAEKRKRDGAIQVVVVPLAPTTVFNYSGMAEGAMGAQWNYGKPLVKVQGLIQDKSLTINTIVSILLEEVDDFSVNKNQSKNKNYQFYTSEKRS